MIELMIVVMIQRGTGNQKSGLAAGRGAGDSSWASERHGRVGGDRNACA